MSKIRFAILFMTITFASIGCNSLRDEERAQRALNSYFTSLSDGDYAEAAKLYGGEYETLASWNPNVDPAEHVKLLELGCTANGLQCLPLLEIGAVEYSSPGIFEIYVQFENPDGSQFVLEYPDPSTSGSVNRSDFKFTVMKENDNFVVRELPPYVP